MQYIQNNNLPKQRHQHGNAARLKQQLNVHPKHFLDPGNSKSIKSKSTENFYFAGKTLPQVWYILGQECAKKDHESQKQNHNNNIKNDVKNNKENVRKIRMRILEIVFNMIFTSIEQCHEADVPHEQLQLQQ